MNDDALIFHDQHALNTQNIKNKTVIENSESSSSFKSFDFDSNSVLEQLLCFSPATSVQNSDSDPEYLPSKKPCKSVDTSVDHPKSTCRRSARLSTVKDEQATNLFSLPLPTSEDPEYFPPKGILYALKKSVNEAVPKSDIIANVKQRKVRRSKKIVDPACNSCNGRNHEKLSMSTVEALPAVSMNNSPFSTEQLREILEDSACEEGPKELASKKGTHAPQEVRNHDSKTKENTTLKMPRTRASLKLKVKKKDKKNNLSISATTDSNKECNSEMSVLNSEYKVSKDKVLPKSQFKESKKVLKKRKRQTCRKQFRHKDITLYKLGADPDPVNEAAQKNHVIHKIFLRRSSASAPQVTPQTSKVNNTTEVSESVLSNPNTTSNNQCPENPTVKENSSFESNSSNCDLNNSNKIYCSSISVENHSMNKVPKVILTPINTKDNYYQKSGAPKDQDISSKFRKIHVNQDKPNRHEVGKHNLPIRIPERRTSIAEPLRTPPVPNSKVPSFHAEGPPENQFNYMKIEIKNGNSDNQQVIYVKPAICQEKVVYGGNETNNEPTAISKDLHNGDLQSTKWVSKSNVGQTQSGNLRAINEGQTQNGNLRATNEGQTQNGNLRATNEGQTQNGNLRVTNDPNRIESYLYDVKPTHSRKNDENAEAYKNSSQDIIRKEVVNHLANGKSSHNCANGGQTETLKSASQETPETATCAGPQNLSIKVVKSCSGITDPLKLHKPNSLPGKKIDGDAKNKLNSATPPKENHITHQRTDDPNCSAAQTISPMNSTETPHKSSPILQQNLLNGPAYKSDIYRNSFQNRANISLNNFNPELSPYALNSLAISNLRTAHSNTVSGTSRNMPIIEEANQQMPNDKVTYDTFTGTSSLVADTTKRNKRGKRKLSRSDLYEESSPKLQRSYNYPNYPSYTYPLSFFAGGPPNPTYNPLPPFSLGIPHSAYNMAPPVYQPKPSSNTGQPSTFDRTAFRNIVPPIINPFLSHEPGLPVSTYSTSNPPATKTYDSRMHYNPFMRFSNPMFMNHNTLPPDYSSIGINNRRPDTLPQTSKSILQQGYDFSPKNFIKNPTRQSPHQIYPFPENTHRRSTEVAESQNTPLALIKTSAPTQSNNWSNIPIVSRNDELTITKLPLRENVPKPTSVLTSAQTCFPANQIDLTALSKPSNVCPNGGSTYSALSISKTNMKTTEPSGYPCSKTSTPERRSGVGSVLHGELANISISLIKNKHDKPTSLLQQDLLPILERAKLMQEEQPLSLLQTAKTGEINRQQPYPTTTGNVQPGITSNIPENDPKVDVAISETTKRVSDGKVERRNSSNSKTMPSSKIYRDIELEIDCTKITKPVKSVGNNQANAESCIVNAKTSLNGTSSKVYNNAGQKQENQISATSSNQKIDEGSSAFSNSENSEQPNSKQKPEAEKSSAAVTVLSDTATELNSPKMIDTTTEAINLSVEKPHKVASTTVPSHNKNIVSSGTTPSPVIGSPKSSNVNTIASIMQDIIHQGDVQKFDEYVETLRRSLENRETHKMDDIKQQFLEKVVDATRNNNAENSAVCSAEHVSAPVISKNTTISSSSSAPANTRDSKAIMTSTDVKMLAPNSLVSENIAMPKTVGEVTKTTVPVTTLVSENRHTQVFHGTNVVASKCFGTTGQSVDSHSPISAKVFPTELNTQAVDSTSKTVSSNVSSFPCAIVESNEHIVESENVIQTEKTNNSKSKFDSETVQMSEKCTAEDGNSNDDSSNGVVSNCQKVTTNTKDSSTTTDSQNAVVTQSISTPVLNSESVSGIEISTQIQTVDAAVTEKTPTRIDPLAIEIKKEIIDEDEDLIIVYDSFEKVNTSTEDKGIQADISTLFPQSVDANYLKVRALKRKKWKFSETNRSTKVPKINKMHIQKIEKEKTTIQAQTSMKGVLRKQLLSKKLEATKNTTTCQNEPHRPKSQLSTTKVKAKHSKKASTKSCETLNSKLSVDSCQEDKTELICSAKLCQTVSNKLTDGGSFMSKASTGTSTEPYKTDNSKLSDVTSQTSETSMPTTTKQSQVGNEQLFEGSSEVSQNLIASENSCERIKIKLAGDKFQISKTSDTKSDNNLKVNSKSSNNNTIKTRISKRLLLKQSRKTYTNKNMNLHHTNLSPKNSELLSRSNESSSTECGKLAQSQSCDVTPSAPEAPTSQHMNYILRNSEIIQNRCFVRLSRIVETSKTNTNQVDDSKDDNDKKEKSLNRGSDAEVPLIKPTSDFVQKTQEVESLNGVSSNNSRNPAINNRHGKNKKKGAKSSLQMPQTTTSSNSTTTSKLEAVTNQTGNPTEVTDRSTYSSKIGNSKSESSNTSLPEHIGNRPDKSFENTSRLSADNKKVISAVQIPPKLTSPQNIGNREISDNLSTDNVTPKPDVPLPTIKISEQALIPSPPLPANNPDDSVQQSPTASKMSPLVAKIVPPKSSSDNDQIDNSTSETAPSVKDVSNALADSYNHNSTESMQSKNSSVQMSQKSLSPQVVSSPPITVASNKSPTLPQKSNPADLLPKEIPINTCRDGSNNNQNVNYTGGKVPSLKEISAEITNTYNNNSNKQSEKNLGQEQAKPISLRELSKQTSSTRTTNSANQVPQEVAASKTADVAYTEDLSSDNLNMDTSASMFNKWAALSELLEQTAFRNENNYNLMNNDFMRQRANKTSQISAFSSTIYKNANNGSHINRKSNETVQHTTAPRTLSQTVTKPISVQATRDNRVNNPSQVGQESHTSQVPRFSPNMPMHVNTRNQTTDNLIEVPQTLPSVIKPTIADGTGKSRIIARRPSNVMNNDIAIPQKSPSLIQTLIRTPTAYSLTNAPKDSLGRLASHCSNTAEMPRTSFQNFNTANTRVSSSSSNNMPVQIAANNSVKTPKSSPSVNKPRDSKASPATYKYMHHEQTNNKPITVPQISPSNTLQPTFTTPTDFYRYGYNGQEIGNNANSASSYPRSSPQFANVSSANNVPLQTPQKSTYVGRTSYQISKIPPMAHRRASSSNQTTDNSGQMLQQPPLSNMTPRNLSNIYNYGTRNVDCEIDLTVSSKSTSREDASNQSLNKKDIKTPSPKTPKGSLSKYEHENPYKPVASDTMVNTHPSYAGFQENSRYYPQKSIEYPVHNEVGQKIQGMEHPPISFPTNQVMRQNSSSSTSSYNSQFSPNFTQSPPMLNKLYSNTVTPKQVSETANKDVGLRYPNPPAYSTSGQPLEQFCEMPQTRSSGTRPVFTEPKEKYAPLNKPTESRSEQSPETNLPASSLKKRSKEDQNYLNVKVADVQHFNGNLSPDYGYFSPLTKNAPPNYESVVCRPNPIRYNEANSFHNMKYCGVPTVPQRMPMNSAESFHHTNATAPAQNNSSGSTNTYIRQNSKLPVNTANLSIPNGMQHKIQQPDVDKISSILPKLQQQETLNPEQYVLEMSMLEKDGCPRPFLEFYSFVTKKQIASNQLPISFRIFLEFHNAGKLKNFENAFRIYSERHEKEKNLLLKNT